MSHSRIGLTPEQLERKRNYDAKWRSENKEHIKKYYAAWYQRAKEHGGRNR